jgi:hypothetical protein
MYGQLRLPNATAISAVFGFALADAVSDGSQRVGESVGVDTHEHVRAVAEDVGDGAELAGVARLADHMGCGGVAQAVGREAGDAGTEDQAVQRLVEVARVDRLTGARRDDEVVVRPFGTGEQPLLGLELPMGRQDLRRAGIDGNRSTGPGILALCPHRLTTDLDQALVDSDRALPHVDV